MYEIEKGVKLPTIQHKRNDNSKASKIVNVLHKMEVGDSFTLSKSDYKTYTAALYRRAKIFITKKFTARREGEKYRVYRTK